MKYRKKGPRRNPRACICGWKYAKRNGNAAGGDPRKMRKKLALKEARAEA